MDGGGDVMMRRVWPELRLCGLHVGGFEGRVAEGGV